MNPGIVQAQMRGHTPAAATPRPGQTMPGMMMPAPQKRVPPGYNPAAPATQLTGNFSAAPARPGTPMPPPPMGQAPQARPMPTPPPATPGAGPGQPPMNPGVIRLMQQRGM